MEVNREQNEVMEPKLLVTLPSHSPSPGDRGAVTSSAPDSSLLIPAGFVILSAIAISIYVFIPKQIHQAALDLKCRSKVPCRHCRYFSHNNYLRCSVHPTTAMTEKAIDCQDYDPIVRSNR